MFTVEYLDTTGAMTNGQPVWVHFDECDSYRAALEIADRCRAAHPHHRVRITKIDSRND
jgi:ribulose bisphosphate carboxylase small subunit